MMKRGWLYAFRVQSLCIVCFFLLLVSFAWAESDDDLAALSLEELMEVEVVTSSRRAEPLSQVAGAVTVLDEDDIFRSGATTIAEALKLVPGLHVVQMDTDKWAVGIRGFNGILSNKHLVLLDGRPITSPTTAGVVWGNTIPVSMVKRIEVVRGVWTHLWGADSFTGVINIITKSAAETQGGQSVTLAGSTGVEQLFRYGDTVDDVVYRGYLSGGYRTGDWITGEGDDRSSRDWVKQQGGFRVDWENAFTDSLSLQGDFAASSINDGASGSRKIFRPHVRDEFNGYGQFSWNRATGLDAGIGFRTSFTRELVSVADLTGGTNTLDAELQYAAEQYGRHRLTWGLGSRYFWDDIESGDNSFIDKENRYTFTSNGFVQDRVTLMEDSLYLFLGGKLDYFGQTSVEVQPTIRLLHTREDSEYWLAVSRAVRADTRLQRSGSYSIEHNGEVYTVHTPDSLTTEKLIAYEAGYRQRFTSDIHGDLSFYINDYDQLAMIEFDRAMRTATLRNSLEGEAYGVEAILDWTVNQWLRLCPSISLVYQDIRGVDFPPSGDSMPEEGLSSEYKLHVFTKPLQDVGFDILAGYSVSPDERFMPGYFSLEAHASWKASETLMLELIGRNFGEVTSQYSPLHIGPSVDLRMTWDF